jgi:hypothetical protein
MAELRIEPFAVIVDGLYLTEAAEPIAGGVYVFPSRDAAFNWTFDRLVESGDIKPRTRGGWSVVDTLGTFDDRAAAFAEFQYGLTESERLELVPVRRMPTGDVPAVTSDTRPADVVAAFNAVFGRKVVATPKRQRTIRERLRDPFWRENWRDMLAHAGRLPFCNGVNDRRWHATIDWFIRPDTVAKLYEGRHDDAHTFGGNHETREARNANAFGVIEQNVFADTGGRIDFSGNQ